MNEECPKCLDTGKIEVQNGPDDFELMYCDCRIGDNLRYDETTSTAEKMDDEA